VPYGRRVTGQDLLARTDWLWRDSLRVPGMRYARLTATNPSYGAVTVVLVAHPCKGRYYLLCRTTRFTAPRLIRAYDRRSWIEQWLCTLKHLLTAEACRTQTEDAYYRYLVVRRLAGLVPLYTARVIFKGRVTMEEILFSLKHYWRFLDSELLELPGHSCDLR
jgi:hypothetical protein